MNNGDLISREAVIDDLKNWRDKDHFKKHRGWFERIERWVRITTIIKVMKLFPAVDDVEVKHAKWIRPTKISGRNFDIPHCSACHEVPCGADGNYCPNCGARMDGE